MNFESASIELQNILNLIKEICLKCEEDAWERVISLQLG
jgi:hypothetical protein